MPAPASISAEQNRSSSICHDPKPACHVGCKLSPPPLSHPPFEQAAQPRRAAPGENKSPPKPVGWALPPTLPPHRRRQLPAIGTSRASAGAATTGPRGPSTRHSIPGGAEGSPAIFFSATHRNPYHVPGGGIFCFFGDLHAPKILHTRVFSRPRMCLEIPDPTGAAAPLIITIHVFGFF